MRLLGFFSFSKSFRMLIYAVYRDRLKGLYVVATNFFLLLLNLFCLAVA